MQHFIYISSYLTAMTQEVENFQIFYGRQLLIAIRFCQHFNINFGQKTKKDYRTVTFC